MLQAWTRPDYYFGATWEGWLVGLAQNRNSDTLMRSNFQVFLAALKALEPTGEGGEEGEGMDAIQVVRENHWACGWVEWIAIHPSHAAAVDLAEDMLARLEHHAVLDEDHFTRLEDEEAQTAWEGLSLADKVRLVQEARVSVFAARHERFPSDDQGTVQQRLLGY